VLLGVQCAAQQTAPVAVPSASQAPAATSGDAGQNPDAPSQVAPKNADEARAILRHDEQEHPGDTEEVAKDLASVALLEAAYQKTTDRTLAEARRAVAIAEKVKGKQSSLYSYTLAVEARVELELDRPDLARPMAEQALATARSVNPPPDEYANVVSALSTICSRQSDLDCSVRTAELQVEIARKDTERGPTFLASALTALAGFYYRSHNTAGSERTLNELLALEAEQTDLSSPVWQTTENSAGNYYNSIGQFEKAREHLMKGIAQVVKQSGPDSLDQATLLANLALAEMGLGHLEDAQRDFLRAHDMHVRRFGPAHSRTADVDFRYAETLHFLGRDKDAMDWALKAHAAQREYVSLVIRLMPERQALEVAGTGMPSLGAAVTVAMEHPELDATAVYQEVVRSRALVAEEMAMRAAGLNRKPDPDVDALEKELAQDRQAVMNLEGSGNKSPDALDAATAKMEKAERELAERSAEFRTDERERSSALADLRQHLPADAVLISYLKYGKIPSAPQNFKADNVDWYAAFVMHPDGRPIARFQLAQSKDVSVLIERMRDSAQAEARGGGMNARRNAREYRAAGEQLRKLIWDPLAREIGNAKRVFVVPDGVLNLVPFSGLPSGTGYMVERGPVVHILSSERDLLPDPAEGKKTGLLAVGNPAFEQARLEDAANRLRGGAIDCEAFRKMQFQPLPASLGEVKEISAEWGRWNGGERAQLLTGTEATRARFIAEAAQSRVLHIATHAFVLDQACGKGNPLLHSGLVFAGVNRTRDESVLTAQQIASLDLRGVDWAVLSACNSGYGELKDGEGVLGLERSFRVAGARSVVMALWPVDDAGARGFMRTLYAERYGRRESTADALWNASRKTLERRRAAGESTHPWYWASFVAAGGWE
jgi:CHAT domain-containing protein